MCLVILKSERNTINWARTGSSTRMRILVPMENLGPGIKEDLTEQAVRKISLVVVAAFLIFLNPSSEVWETEWVEKGIFPSVLILRQPILRGRCQLAFKR